MIKYLRVDILIITEYRIGIYIQLSKKIPFKVIHKNTHGIWNLCQLNIFALVSYKLSNCLKVIF